MLTHTHTFNNSLGSKKKEEKSKERERILIKVNYYLVQLWISSAYFALQHKYTQHLHTHPPHTIEWFAFCKACVWKNSTRPFTNFQREKGI